MVVVQIAGDSDIQKAAEVVQAVTVMSSDRCVKSSGQLANVAIVVNLAKQRLSLVENLNYAANQRLSFSKKCRIHACEGWSLSQAQPYRLFPFLFHESGPIRIGLRKIALCVLVEIIAHTLAVLKQQMAIDDLKCFRIDFH